MNLRPGVGRGLQKTRREEIVFVLKFGLHLVEPMLHWSWLA